MSVPTVTSREREAHAQLDRLLTLIRAHGSGAGTLRVRVDRAGVLHVEARAELDLAHPCEDAAETGS